MGTVLHFLKRDSSVLFEGDFPRFSARDSSALLVGTVLYLFAIHQTSLKKHSLVLFTQDGFHRTLFDSGAYKDNMSIDLTTKILTLHDCIGIKIYTHSKTSNI